MACLLSAALAYHVPVPAMQGIQAVEGGQEGQEVCQNQDGSCDLGPFQVNDHAWVATIAQDLGVDATAVRTTLRDDACWNAQVAAWILRQMLDEAGGDLPTAIGNYHSHLPLDHMAYRSKVQAALDRLYPSGTPPILPEMAASLPQGSFEMPPLVPAKFLEGHPGPSSRMIMVSGAMPARTLVVRATGYGEASHDEKPANTELRWGRIRSGSTTIVRGNADRTEEEAKRATAALQAQADDPE